MSFTRTLERNFNRDMQRERAGRASRTRHDEDLNIKKHHGEPAAYADEEEEDAEICEKKDRPPRFSTVFGGVASAPAVVEQDSPRRRKSGGILIPLPLFIVLAIFFFLETTFLFTYTIIGLYNNRPTGVLPFGAVASPLDSCNCAEKQAGINIAPNFVIPQQAQAATVTITQTTTDGSRPDLVPLPVPPSTLTKSVSVTVNSKSDSSSTKTTPAGQSAASTPTASSHETSTTSSLIDPAKGAKSAISAIASLLHATKNVAKTTPKPTSTKITSSTTSKSTHSSEPAGLSGCLAGEGSVQCSTSKDIIPEEE